MNALEEMKKRREEEEAAKDAAIKMEMKAEQEDAEAHSNSVQNDMRLFIEKINSYGTGKKNEVDQKLDMYDLRDAIANKSLLDKYIAKSHPEWLDAINNNNDFIRQLTPAVNDAKERMDKLDKKIKMRHRKRTALICLPLSVLFFFLLFVFKNVSLVWGSVILMVIMVVVNFMFMGSHSIENKIAQLISIPFLGGFLGLVIGGGAWVISNISMTFTAVLWAIVIFIANMIVIFAFDEAELD